MSQKWRDAIARRKEQGQSTLNRRIQKEQEAFQAREERMRQIKLAAGALASFLMNGEGKDAKDLVRCTGRTIVLARGDSHTYAFNESGLCRCRGNIWNDEFRRSMANSNTEIVVVRTLEDPKSGLTDPAQFMTWFRGKIDAVANEVLSLSETK